jgi:hypothetical protein
MVYEASPTNVPISRHFLLSGNRWPPTSSPSTCASNVGYLLQAYELILFQHERNRRVIGFRDITEFGSHVVLLGRGTQFTLLFDLLT